MNDCIPFMAASVLKECGFHELVLSCYHDDTKLFVFHHTYGDFNSVDGCISAPTIPQAVEWLWNKHGIFVRVEHDTLLDNTHVFNYGLYLDEGRNRLVDGYVGIVRGGCRTPNEAMMGGLNLACVYLAQHKEGGAR